MSTLAYRTRGNSSPQGKPWVYFSCHPEEQSLFLEDIAREILALYNCAVWYDPQPGTEVDWEERKLDLQEMQLFVMPVTGRLLSRPSDAMDREFPFALENHIPVLPLLEEQGLERLFNEKFQDIQFLDPHCQDPTALPYKDKLKKYLDSVLIGDELAAQVRAAFDAYIFLSYRKKDRRAAQQLMRLIHENDFCRDIAIWYDEYLTPGENFNQAIQDALEKSQLFALVVTPSLLEKPNYVMTAEYPRAKEARKAVLPVEMQPTDRTELESSYEELPPCVEGEDGPALSAELLDRLQNLALRENDSDPRHNYFIGLAYLAGIDVEVNHKRALELIRSAAEGNYVPAMEKLVNMYRAGEGVARDYRTAIQWQQRLVNYWKELWEKESSEKNFEEYTCVLWDLGDYYQELQDLKNWRRVWQEKMLPLCETVWKERGFARAQRCQAVSYSKLGDICRAEGDLAGARSYYEQNLELTKQLAEEAPALQNGRDLSISYNRMGEICQAQGNLAGARNYYVQCLELFKQLVEESPTLQNRRGLAISYRRMGDICQAQGDLARARSYYQQDLELSKQLAEESPTLENRRGLSVSCDRMGDICKARGDLVRARRYYEQDLELSKQLVEEGPTLENRSGLAISYERMGDICKAQGDLAGARSYYQQYLELCEQMVEESPTLENRSGLAISHERMGDICQAQDDLAGARSYYEQALELFKQLAEESPTLENRRGLSISCSKMGDICQAQGDLAGARSYYKQDLELSKQLAEESPTLENRKGLSISYERMGNICKAQGDFAGAQSYYEQALELFKQLAEESPTLENRRGLAIGYERMGDICKVQSDLAGARSYYEQDLELSKQLAEESPTLENRKRLSISYGKMGELCQAQGDLAEARSYYEQELELSERLMEQSSSPQAWDDLALACYKVGVLEKGDSVSLRKALEIWKRMAKEHPEVSAYNENYKLARRMLYNPFFRLLRWIYRRL